MLSCPSSAVRVEIPRIRLSRDVHPRSCRSGHGPFDWRNEATIIALPPETASDARKLSEAALPIAMMKQAPAPTACTAVSA
jgi:hypothetical protein